SDSKDLNSKDLQDDSALLTSQLTSDSDFVRLAAAWPSLSPPIRAAVLALIGTAGKPTAGPPDPRARRMNDGQPPEGPLPQLKAAGPDATHSSVGTGRPRECNR